MEEELNEKKRNLCAHRDLFKVYSHQAQSNKCIHFLTELNEKVITFNAK